MDEDSSPDAPTDRAETEPDSTADADGDGTAASADEEPDPGDRSLGVGVVTIASDRTLDTDPVGEAIVTVLKKDDHEVATREHVGTEHDRVQSIVSRMIDRDDVDFVVTGGATGIEPSDITIEAVEPLLDKELTAFDELFTSMAYEAVGTRVVAARTLAGIAEGIPVFCLPGDADAGRLGLEEIVLPEIRHLVELAREADVPAEHDPSAERTEPDEAVVDESEPGGENDSEDGGE